MRRELIAHQLELSLRETLEAPQLRVTAVSGERPASDEQREPWIAIKYGPAGPDDWFGVVPTSVRFERTLGAAPESLELVTKVNPSQGLARTLIPWIIEHRKIALDRPYWEYRSADESDHTSGREQQLYMLAQSTPELGRVLPRCYGTVSDAASGEHALFLECIADAARLDATGALADWPTGAIDAALSAAAPWQAAFWNAQTEQVPWAGRRLTTQDMTADVPLWRGLLADARKRFPNIVTDEIWRRRDGFIDRLNDWHRAKDQLPATLVHDDFNQRNIGFRPAVVVLDWELVQLNTAHRDVVELLTFVLPPSADRRQVDAHIERHRTRLVALGVSTGVIATRGWRASGASSRWKRSIASVCNCCSARSFHSHTSRASTATSSVSSPCTHSQGSWISRRNGGKLLMARGPRVQICPQLASARSSGVGALPIVMRLQ